MPNVLKGPSTCTIPIDKSTFPVVRRDALSERQLMFLDAHIKDLEEAYDRQPFAYPREKIPNIAYKMTAALCRKSGSVGPLVKKTLQRFNAPTTYEGAAQWMQEK